MGKYRGFGQKGQVSTGMSKETGHRFKPEGKVVEEVRGQGALFAAAWFV